MLSLCVDNPTLDKLIGDTADDALRHQIVSCVIFNVVLRIELLLNDLGLNRDFAERFFIFVLICLAWIVVPRRQTIFAFNLFSDFTGVDDCSDLLARNECIRVILHSEAVNVWANESREPKSSEKFLFCKLLWDFCAHFEVSRQKLFAIDAVKPCYSCTFFRVGICKVKLDASD